MGRSLKKGPFADSKLLRKVEQLNQTNHLKEYGTEWV